MKNTLLLLTVVFLCFLKSNGQIQKISQTKLLKDLYEAQKLIDAKEYDKGLGLLSEIRNGIGNAGTDQNQRIGFFYIRTIQLESKAHKNTGNLESMLVFAPKVTKDYLKLFNDDNSIISITSQLALSLKTFRTHKNYTDALDTYIFLKEKLETTNVSKYVVLLIDNEIDYINNHISKQDKNNASLVSQNKKGNAKNKLRIEAYQSPYDDENIISNLDSSLGEMMGQLVKYQDTMLGLFGLKEGFETKNMKLSDININTDMIDALKKRGGLNDTEGSFNIDDIKPMLEMFKRFDTILPTKMKRESRRNLESLEKTGKEGSNIYKLEQVISIVTNMITGETSDELENQIKTLENSISETDFLSEEDFDDIEKKTAESLFYTYFIKGDYKGALEQSLKMYHKDSIEDKSNWMFMIAMMYSSMKDFSNAELWSKKLIMYKGPIEKGEKYVQQDKYTFKDVAYTIYIEALIANKKYKEALEASNDFEHLLKEHSDEIDIDNDNSFLPMLNSSKAIALSKLGQYEKADGYMSKQFEIVNNARLDSLLFRFSYMKNDLDTKRPFSPINMITLSSDYVFHYLYERPKKSDSLIGIAYNSALIYKESLLNTETTLGKNIISKSEDKSLKSIYYKWIEAKELASDINTKDRDSILDYVMFYKRKLMQSGYGNLIQEIKESELNWKSIKNNLTTNQAAIEFVRFSPYTFDKNHDNKLYGALVITKESEYPEFIYLFNEKELDRILRPFTTSNGSINKLVNNLYTNQGDSPYNLIWKPLENKLKNVETIYYSPSGMLNNLAFSAFQNPTDNKLLADKHKLIQVASTKYVVQNKKSKKILNSALLFGGLNYNMNTKTIRAIENYQHQTDSVRGGGKWRRLGGTKQEVEGIDKIFKSKNITTHLKTGTEGLEDTFYDEIKSINPSIIHVATHAFYESSNESAKSRVLLEGYEKLKQDGDNLNKSGLVFSGANYFWEFGKKKVPNLEDGILTANEIASLDLSHTELITLSACETGIGKSLNNEGVIGIQRGLKMAGAKTALLSLWKVNDTVTKEYMLSFYDYLINKNYSIEDAYIKTQDLIRQKHPEPYKWAAFVLIRNY